MFPKTGKTLPPGGGRISSADYAAWVAEVLRDELGSSHQAHKTLMRWTGANERTAKNWLSGANGPSGEHLLQLVRYSDAVFACVMRLADRKAFMPNSKLADLRDSLQMSSALLSELIDEQDKASKH